MGAVVVEELPTGVVDDIDEDRQKQASPALGVDLAHHHPEQDQRHCLAGGGNQVGPVPPSRRRPTTSRHATPGSDHRRRSHIAAR